MHHISASDSKLFLHHLGPFGDPNLTSTLDPLRPLLCHRYMARTVLATCCLLTTRASNRLRETKEKGEIDAAVSVSRLEIVPVGLVEKGAVEENTTVLLIRDVFLDVITGEA